MYQIPVGSSFGYVRTGFEQRLKRLDAFGSVCEMKSDNVSTEQYFFSQYLEPHAFVFLFLFYNTLPTSMFCFSRKCGVRFSIIICIDNERILFEMLMEF